MSVTGLENEPEVSDETAVVPAPRAKSRTGAAVVVGLLLILTLGADFRLVGLFKSVRNTAFAQWDSWLYSPLSLALGIAALWLATRPRPS